MKRLSLALTGISMAFVVLLAGTVPENRATDVEKRLLPTLLYVLDYSYFDHYFTQTLNNNSTYREIEAYVKKEGGTARSSIRLVGHDAAKSVTWADPRAAAASGARPAQIQYAAPKVMA